MPIGPPWNVGCGFGNDEVPNTRSGTSGCDHPLFNVREFDLASRNRFFLCLRPGDAKFAPQTARTFLRELHPMGIWDVPE